MGKCDKYIEVIQEKPNYLDTIIKCPYCGHITTVGDTIMNSGYIGCPSCYWVRGGLCDTVNDLKDNHYEEYLSGEFYDRGFNNFRQKEKGVK